MRHKQNKTNVKDNLYQVWTLTKRNLLLFLKNPTSIVFSLITPVLILVIFIFLINEQTMEMALELIQKQNPGFSNVTPSQLLMIAQGWMVAGIVGIAILTIGLNTMFIRIKDQENNTIKDYVASPVNIVYLALSYFLSSFILTFMICFLFLIAGLVYLSIAYQVLFSTVVFLELVAILFLGTLSGIIILMVITSFFNKSSTASSFTGVFSALIGFLVGAYLPIGLLPSSLQNVANLIPGSHSTGLFRKVILNELILKLNLNSVIEPVAMENLRASFGVDLTLFGYKMDAWFMYIYLIISLIIFFIIYLLIERTRSQIHFHGDLKGKKYQSKNRK